VEHFDRGEGTNLDKGAAAIAAREADTRALARQMWVKTSDARLVVLGSSAREAQLLLVRDRDIRLHRVAITFFGWYGRQVISLDRVDSVDLADSVAFQGAQGTRTVVIRGPGKRIIITLAADEAEYLKHYLQAAVRKSRSAQPQDSDGSPKPQ